MENWIAPRLRCGLGNRLFQTAAAIQTAAKLKREAVFLLPRMSHWDHGNFSALLALVPSLPIKESAQSWTEIAETADQQVPASTPLTQEGLVISGFFQNSQTWDLSIPTMPTLPGPALPKREAWAVHFRFGDYSLLPHYQVPYLADYYAKALDLHVPKGSTLVLFSDDKVKILALAKELEEREYRVDLCLTDDPLDTFETWASCTKGAIASNSTFAWWAAYFAYKRYGTKAFFPDTWMTNQPTPNILTLPFTQTMRVEKWLQGTPLKSFFYR
jgi:hypothetical protein